jgi:hypothetical protein
VFKERAYALAWHPSPHRAALVAGDKMGHIGLWNVDAAAAAAAAGGAAAAGAEEELAQFRPHLGSVSRLQFMPGDRTRVRARRVAVQFPHGILNAAISGRLF